MSHCRKQTPLHCAVESSHLDAVELLVKHGAKVNTKNSSGQTPVYLASEQGLVSVVSCLVASGADPAIRSVDGFSALDVASPSVSCLMREEEEEGAGLAAGLAAGGGKGNSELVERLLEASKNGDFEQVKVGRITGMERISVNVIAIHVH